MLLSTIKTAAGVLGMTGVTLGAFGAHALKARLAAAGMSEAWDTAVQYHLIHAVALVALAALATGAPAGSNTTQPSRWFSRAAWAWIAGSVLFCGSIYVLALGGPRWLGPVTPLGGVALLVGWACLLVPARSGSAAHSPRE